MKNQYGSARQRLGIVLVVATLAQGAWAQSGPIVVSPQVRMSPGTEEWFECSVAVSQTNKNDVLVMASRDLGGTLGNLGYVAVSWAGGSPTIGTVDLGHIDVYLTPHPTDGSIWFTALGPEGTVAGWKDAGQSSIPTGRIQYVSTFPLEDKPGIAIGLLPPAMTDLRYYVLRASRLAGGCQDRTQEKVSYADDPYINWSWTTGRVEPDPINLPGACDYLGLGAAPVVLESGRIVVALKDKEAGGVWKYNQGKPYVVYSDDGGVDWLPDDPTTPIRIAPGDLAFTTTVLEDCYNVCPSTLCDPRDPTGAACSTCGDTPMQIDARNCFPAIAVDREPDPDHVYVAFYAKSAENSSNTDLFIHRSVNGGQTFDATQGSPDFLQVTDAMLGLVAGDYGADQLMPAIAIDSCGGVNVMFYDNRNDPDLEDCDLLFDVYYARISGFGGTPTVAQWRLTPQRFHVENITGYKDFLGDYHHMTASADGTTLYMAYIARNNADPVNGVRTCYLHRVNLNCVGPGGADFTQDGQVASDDLDAFGDAFSAGDASADVDLDWIVGVNDFVTYFEWYASAE